MTHRQSPRSRKSRRKSKKSRRKKSQRRKKLRPWGTLTAMTPKGRAKMKPSSFLLITKKGRRLYPDATRQNKKSCQGVLAAKMRSALQMHTKAPYGSAKSRRQARKVNRKATALAKAHGCVSMRSHYKKSSKRRKSKRRKSKKKR